MKQKKSKVKRHINEEAFKADPLAKLGFGIVAYIDILYTLIWVFVGFSILVFPTIAAFSSGTAYEGDQYVGFAGTMISNLGYSSAVCTNTPLSIGSLTMTCNVGTIGQIFDFGITNPDSDGPVDACLTNDSNKACKPDNKDAADLFTATIGQSRATVRFSEADLFNGGASTGCAGPTNNLFVQYSCVQAEEDQ